ncbi:hypothetical protein T01_3791, partial [Trichinella spiralis]
MRKGDAELEYNTFDLLLSKLTKHKTYWQLEFIRTAEIIENSERIRTVRYSYYG